MSETRGSKPPQEIPETRPVEMVDVSRVSTVFKDHGVLTTIADKLMRLGLISGYEITPATSGYIYKGKATTDDDQFRLEILCDDPQKLEEIKMHIAGEIGKKWDVPKITEDKIRVNRELVGFIKNVEKEHRRFLNQRRLTRSVSLAALLSLGGVVTSFIDDFLEGQREAAVAAQRIESLERMRVLNEVIEKKVLEIEEKLREDDPLTSREPDEFGVETYQETQAILQITRQAETEMKKHLEAQVQE